MSLWHLSLPFEEGSSWLKRFLHSYWPGTGFLNSQVTPCLVICWDQLNCAQLICQHKEFAHRGSFTSVTLKAMLCGCQQGTNYLLHFEDILTGQIREIYMSVPASYMKDVTVQYLPGIVDGSDLSPHSCRINLVSGGEGHLDTNLKYFVWRN